MTDKDRKDEILQGADRRAFLRRFFRKSAPLVVGAVAKPLSTFQASAPPQTIASPGPAARAAYEAETIAEDLKKEFEKTHEEFIKNNPDFFE